MVAKSRLASDVAFNSLQRKDSNAKHIATLNRLMKGVNPATIEVFKSGLFYILGRDKFSRPIIVGDADRAGVLSKERINAIIDAFTLISFITRFSMHVPGKVENSLFFFNLRNQNKPDMQMLLLDQAKIVNSNCPGTLEKLFLFETPAFIRFLIFLARPFFAKETLDKVFVVDEKNIHKVEEYVSLNVLEKSFGGKGEPITDFYPFNVKTENQLTKEDLFANGIIPFTSSEDDFVHYPIELIKQQIDQFHHQEKILKIMEDYIESKKMKYVATQTSPKVIEEEKVEDEFSLMDSIFFGYRFKKEKIPQNGISMKQGQEQNDENDDDFCNIFQQTRVKVYYQ